MLYIYFLLFLLVGDKVLLCNQASLEFVAILLSHLSAWIYKYKPYAYIQTLNNKTLPVTDSDKLTMKLPT